MFTFYPRLSDDSLSIRLNHLPRSAGAAVAMSFQTQQLIVLANPQGLLF